MKMNKQALGPDRLIVESAWWSQPDRAWLPTRDLRQRADGSADERAAAIAELAYRLWEERGCPEGAPEEDWYAAEYIIDQ